MVKPLSSSKLKNAPSRKYTEKYSKITIDKVALLADEWDSKKNGPASRYTIGSNKKVWWRCSLGHKFQASPNSRSGPLAKQGRLTECQICRTKRRWTWEHIVKTAAKVQKKFDHLPPAPWFSKNGYSGMVGAIYKLGRTWIDLREAVDSYETSNHEPSRSGIRWRSKTEACLSDFLYARGVEHTKPRKYSPSYSKESGKAYGVYDLHFRKPNSNEWVDVEVFGGPFGSSGAAIQSDIEEYERVKQAKIAFNKGNRNFLAIEYKDCYSEAALERLLRPFIGILPVIKHKHDLDHFVPTNFWSTGEEVLATCRHIAGLQKDGVFPSEHWLCKKGQHANREGEAYPSLPDAIRTHFGGVNELRKILGQQEHNRFKWSTESVLSELDKWMKRYGRTPGKICTAFKNGNRSISESEVRRGNVISTMAQKYCGGVTKARRLLGYDIKPEVKKSSSLALLHKAVADIDNLAKEIDEEGISRQIRLRVKKIYLYAGQLERGQPMNKESG